MIVRWWVAVLLVGFLGLTGAQSEELSRPRLPVHTLLAHQVLHYIASSRLQTPAVLPSINIVNSPNPELVEQNPCTTCDSTLRLLPLSDNARQNVGTVTVHDLNVRTGPGTDMVILSKIHYGETYSVSGRNANSTWYQITLDEFFGNKGWVSAQFLVVEGPQDIPVLSDNTSPYTAYFVLADDASMYAGPDTNYPVPPYHIFAGMTVHVIGRNVSATWFQVKTDNGTAWIRREHLAENLPSNAFSITG